MTHVDRESISDMTYNNKAGTAIEKWTVPALLLMLTDSRCIIVRRAWGWRGSLDKRAVCHRQVR